MTQTTASTPTESLPDPLFVRPREGRMVAGVCAGIADRWGLDRTVVRLVTAVAALASGVGFAAYVVAWLFTPSTDGPAPLQSGSPLAVRLHRHADRLGRRWPGLLVLAVVAVVVVSLIHALWWAPPVALVALLLLLVVGTRRGRWALVAAVAVLAAGATAVGVAGPHLGTRSVTVASVSDLRGEYDYGVGRLDLDLSALSGASGRHRTDVRMGRGDVVVTVPRDVPVIVHARAGLGSVSIDGHRVGGIDAEQRQLVGDGAQTAQDRLLVDVIVGVGSVHIRTR